MPSKAEHEAIAAALMELNGSADAGRGLWWEAGVRDDLDSEEPELAYATARLRSRPGASRA